jgi:hypothetical protein
LSFLFRSAWDGTAQPCVPRRFIPYSWTGEWVGRNESGRVVSVAFWECLRSGLVAAAICLRLLAFCRLLVPSAICLCLVAFIIYHPSPSIISFYRQLLPPPTPTICQLFPPPSALASPLLSAYLKILYLILYLLSPSLLFPSLSSFSLTIPSFLALHFPFPLLSIKSI